MNELNIKELEQAAEAFAARLAPALMEEWTGRVADIADIKPGQRVLDVACGTGILTRIVAERTGSPGRVTGVDINPGMLGCCQAYFTGYGDAIQLVVIFAAVCPQQQSLQEKEDDMKKTIIFTCLMVILTAGFAFAHGNGWGGGQHGQMMRPGMMGGGYGGQMMGPGMMGGGYGGQMMGPGMMGGGYGGQMMGPGTGGGNCSCPCGACFGQNYQNNDAYQKFMDDTVDLRKELNSKRFEYSEKMRNPNTNREEIDSLAKEIFNLQQQLQDKARKY